MKLGPHTITVLRATQGTSDYGTGTTADWASPAQLEVPGCSVQPAPAPEYTVDRDSFISRWVVYAPAGTDVQATDRVQWNGNTYDVEGDPERWDFPPLSHVVINLHRSQEGAST